jgi:hypothetical protein
MANTVRNSILAAIAAGAAIFPAALHVRNQPQKERALLFADLNNARVGLYTNTTGGDSIYKWGYIGSNPRGPHGFSVRPPTPSLIDTNNFKWYRSNRANLIQIKDAWAEDWTWHGPPTVAGASDEQTNMFVCPTPFAYFQYVEAPTNLFDYTPYRLLSGGGPYTNDIYLGHLHGFINTNTQNGGPFVAGTREQWYTSDYGYDPTWNVMTNAYYSERIIVGRCGISQPFTATDDPVVGPDQDVTVNYSNTWVTAKQPSGGTFTSPFVSFTASNISYWAIEKINFGSETNFIEYSDFEDIFNGGVSSNGVDVYVYTNGNFFAPSDVGVRLPSAVPGNMNDPFEIFGEQVVPWYDRGDQAFVWRGDQALITDTEAGTADHLVVPWEGNPRESRFGTYTGTIGDLAYTNALGNYVNGRENGTLAFVRCALFKQEMQYLSMTVNSNAIPAGETLSVTLYAQSCYGMDNAVQTGIDDDGLDPYVGTSLETYNIVDTYNVSETNLTFVLISSPESASSTQYDPNGLISSGYYHPNPELGYSYSAPDYFLRTSEQVIGMDGYNIDNFGITIRLKLD